MIIVTDMCSTELSRHEQYAANHSLAAHNFERTSNSAVTKNSFCRFPHLDIAAVAVGNLLDIW